MRNAVLFALVFAFSPALAAAVRPAPAGAGGIPVLVCAGTPDVLLVGGLM